MGPRRARNGGNAVHPPGSPLQRWIAPSKLVVLNVINAVLPRAASQHCTHHRASPASIGLSRKYSASSTPNMSPAGLYPDVLPYCNRALLAPHTPRLALTAYAAVTNHNANAAPIV